MDQVFDVFVRDAAAYAVELHGKPSATDAQQHLAQQLVRRPVHDAEGYARVYAEVMAWDGRYTMQP